MCKGTLETPSRTISNDVVRDGFSTTADTAILGF